jgi:hypothetical protein
VELHAHTLNHRLRVSQAFRHGPDWTMTCSGVLAAEASGVHVGPAIDERPERLEVTGAGRGVSDDAEKLMDAIQIGAVLVQLMADLTARRA